MLTALIMAGGKGTRFWPASTDDKPKQFLSLTAENTMLQETVRRLLPLIPIERIFVCTVEKYKHICLEQLPELPEKNVIVEPIGRNTAPCILLSTLYINQMYPDSNIIVLPSDAVVTDEKEQLKVFEDAEQFINENEGIVTMGITPNRPETAYGYIHFSNESFTMGSHEIRVVEAFKEKPNEQIAREYLEDGYYLWNAGMFMFAADFMLGQYKEYATETYKTLTSLPSIDSPNYIAELEEKYGTCESISVDYAIMEKTDKLYVVPVDFGWDDVGSWVRLEKYLKQDNYGNVTKGEHRIFNSNNNIVFSSEKEIVLLDVEDLFVIETEEKVVVGMKESLSKVYELRHK